MIVAVASDKGNVAGHFGHCESFIVFQCENNKVTSNKTVLNPGHRPGFLPNFLNDMGVNVIISGGMGGGAIDIFNGHNIEVVVGTKGSSKVAADLYLKGQLKSTGSVCHEHAHSDDCH